MNFFFAKAAQIHHKKFSVKVFAWFMARLFKSAADASACIKVQANSSSDELLTFR
jgi:hypothetical protein